MLKRAVPWVAALLALTGFSALGAWQLQRAEEKERLIASLERDGGPALEALPAGEGALREQAYRRVDLRGRFLGDRQILLDNRILDGRPGFDVLTPMVLPDGRTVLVDRGWVGWTARREPARPVTIAGGERVQVRGRLWLPEAGIGLGPALAPGDEWPRRATRVEFTALETAIGRDLIRAVIRADGSADWLYRPRDLRPAFGPERHYGYAFQWFALAVTVIAVACILEWRRRRKEH